MTGRKDRIRLGLIWAECDGLIAGHYSYSPGDGWTRWVVMGANGQATAVYRTSEAEAFLDGIRAGRKGEPIGGE